MTLSSLDEEKLRSRGIQVKNIVATLDLNIELDLLNLSSDLPNSEYDPEQYPSLIFRPNEYATVLITNSGKLLFTGGKSVRSIRKAYKILSKELKILGINNTKSLDKIEIVNVVTTYELDSGLDLNYLSVKLGVGNVEYEPEQFPGLIYRINEGPVVLLFASGKIVLTGAKTTQELVDALSKIDLLFSDETSTS